MISSFTREQLARAGSNELSDELERGRIVLFPECPVELPPVADLDFLREELHKRLKHKNISYHPEADTIHGLDGDDAVAERTRSLLKLHAGRVQEFLRRAIPALTGGWKIGTTSFRPLQERGRNLSSHASNELVHVDAGAYGATHGDRVLRFFVNVNPVEDRVWITKGSFPDLYRRFGQEAAVAPETRPPGYLEEGPLDHAWTASTSWLARIVWPTARMLDSSPYDRVMRRFHNFMKDTPRFQESKEGHLEIRFKPFSSWMVLTDMVSHACISGQHALVDTFVIPLKNCRLQELAPINILKGR